MPLFSTFSATESIQVYVWKITESFDDLFQKVALKDISLARLERMKSTQHQRGFLSVRCLLDEAGYTDFDLYYSEDGKPNLADGKQITISHSHDFSVIAISKNPAGIDLELRRELIRKLGPKFCVSEYCFLNPDSEDYIRQLTVIWGVKEAVFKIENKVGISFKDHIFVQPFTMDDKIISVQLSFDNHQRSLQALFYEIESYTLVVVY
uniref:4-phosphopantetheinyl transferase n=1 Tax=Flavobacterium sp. TaxID=239 RepID=UPI0040498479